MPNRKIFCPVCGIEMESYQMDALQYGEDAYCHACGYEFKSEQYKKRIIESRKNVSGGKSEPDTKPSVPVFQKSTNIQKQAQFSGVSQTVTPPVQPIPKTGTVYSAPRSTNASAIRPPVAPKAPQVPPSPVYHPNYQQYQNRDYNAVNLPNLVQINSDFHRKKRDNQQRFNAIKRENERILKKPMIYDEKIYKKKVRDLSLEYRRQNQINEHEFKLAMMRNSNAGEEIIRHIKADYNAIKKTNKKNHKQSLKILKKHYKQIKKRNNLQLKSIMKQNKRDFQKVKKMNRTAFQIATATGVLTQEYQQEFNGMIATGNEYVPYSPEEAFSQVEVTHASSQKEMNEVNPVNITSAASTAKLDRNQPEHDSANTVNPSKTRFDPFTGKPLDDAIKYNPQTGQPLENNDVKQQSQLEPKPEIKTTNSGSKSGEIKQEKDDQILSEEEITVPEEYKDKVFTVLGPEVRVLLNDLPIDEKMKDQLAKSLIYLDEKQQARYLSELKAINEGDSEGKSELIQKIQKMAIPEMQQAQLIDQLNYLTDDSQQNFVETLELVSETDRSEPKVDQTEIEEEIKENSSERDKEMEILLTEREKLLKLKEEKEKQQRYQELELLRLEKVRELKKKIRGEGEGDDEPTSSDSDGKEVPSTTSKATRKKTAE